MVDWSREEVRAIASNLIETSIDTMTFSDLEDFADVSRDKTTDFFVSNDQQSRFCDLVARLVASDCKRNELSTNGADIKALGKDYENMVSFYISKMESKLLTWIPNLESFFERIRCYFKISCAILCRSYKLYRSDDVPMEPWYAALNLYLEKVGAFNDESSIPFSDSSILAGKDSCANYGYQGTGNSKDVLEPRIGNKVPNEKSEMKSSSEPLEALISRSSVLDDDLFILASTASAYDEIQSISSITSDIDDTRLKRKLVPKVRTKSRIETRCISESPSLASMRSVTS
jgi:hypothetical protein